MIKKPYRLFALSVATLLGGTAWAAPQPGDWHLHAGAAWQQYDNDRRLEDTALFGLGLEYGVSERFSTQLSYWRGRSDRERLFLTIDPWRLTFQEVRLDGLYHLQGLAMGPITPYLVGGVGYSHFENQDDDRVWNAARVHLGPGLSWTLNERWRLLADARAAYSPKDERLDVLGSLGLSFNLSGRAASTPMIEPTPVAEPTPAVEAAPILAAPIEPVIETVWIEQQVSTEARVQFATMSAQLSAEAAERLAEVVAFMQRHPDAHAVVSGHADHTGPTSLNLDLSKERARAVVEHLTAQGIEPERLELRHYGYTLPLASNSTESGRAQNRRAEVVAQAVETVAIEIEVDPTLD